jgi:hypothetical protein
LLLRLLSQLLLILVLDLVLLLVLLCPQQRRTETFFFTGGHISGLPPAARRATALAIGLFEPPLKAAHIPLASINFST